MDDFVSLTPLAALQQQQAADELRRSNDVTRRYGLVLSEEQIRALLEKRAEALRDTDRIEFGQGVLLGLAVEFCDSPYLNSQNYEETLAELIDSFFYFKNESHDRMDDDDLIHMMKHYFDGVCQGSLEYLNSTSLEELCRRCRDVGTPGTGPDF